MFKHRILSSDSHVVEPPQLWAERMAPKWGDQIPHMVEREPHGAMWYIGKTPISVVAQLSQGGRKFANPAEVTMRGPFSDVPQGGYIPEAHVQDMDFDGVDGSVLYPSAGLSLFALVQDQKLLRDVFATYNDWLSDFCKPYPKKTKGIAMVLLDNDVEAGVAELKRTAAMGMAGAMISVCPMEGQAYDDPRYENVWATAQELDIPLSFHVATNRPTGESIEMVKGDPGGVSFFHMTNYDYFPRQSLLHMIYTGVFERYPNLKMASVEHELGWIPFYLYSMDRLYRDFQTFRPYTFKGDTMPSDFMRSNVWHGFQEDALGIRLRDLIGVDNLVWGSDYPHNEGTFPESRRIIEEIMDGVPDDEQAKIVGGNTAKLYKFD